MSKAFDPNGVGISNGNIFGFPVSQEEAEIVIFPITFDATASYGKGAANGPKAILDSSTQLDFYHPKLSNAWETKVFMHAISEDALVANEKLNERGMEYIDFLEEGGDLSASPSYQLVVEQITAVQNNIRQDLFTSSVELLNKGKVVGVLGGEHSTPLGLIQAVNETHNSFSILQIDAHADLRDAYENFEQSHASIMFNALQCENLSTLVQVGIRDIAQSEVDIINENGKIHTFFDWDLKEKQFEGESWMFQVDRIVDELDQNVYLSYDIDGLHPSLCPNTGTPVPGGFSLEQITYLIEKVVESGRKIVAFDLCEVAPGEDDWDANVGARTLWSIITLIELSRRN